MRSAQAAYALACGVALTAHVDVTTFDRRRSTSRSSGLSELNAVPCQRSGVGPACAVRLSPSATWCNGRMCYK